MQNENRNESPVGRSLEELTAPRPFGMPPPDTFDGVLLRIEGQMRWCVPSEIRKRIRIARDLAVYGAFCYDFITVSVFWSFTCVEMALWDKFIELNPGPLPVVKKNQQMTIAPKQLPGNLRYGWRLVAVPKFNGSFRSLVEWATDQRLVPKDGSLDAIVNLRNSFAHPFGFSPVLSPPMAVDIFQKVIEIVNHLWPLELPPTSGTLIPAQKD